MPQTTDTTTKPRPRRRYRDYTQADRTAAIAGIEGGGSLREVAAAAQAPQTTIRHWRDEDDRRNGTGTEDATRLWHEMELTSLRAAKGKQDQASFLQLVTAAGISFDKIRLIEGLPTSIVQGDASAAMVALGTALGTALGRRLDARERASVPASEPQPAIEASFVAVSDDAPTPP